MLNSLGFNFEGTQRDAVFRNERYYDVLNYGILESEYNNLKDNGVFKVDKLIMSFVANLRKSK